MMDLVWDLRKAKVLLLSVSETAKVVKWTILLKDQSLTTGDKF